MKTHDFYYELPEELIAQTPLADRSASRLMTLDRTTGAIAHRHFYEIAELLRPGDCLVLNNSRVLPARLLGHRVQSAMRSLFNLHMISQIIIRWRRRRST